MPPKDKKQQGDFTTETATEDQVVVEVATPTPEPEVAAAPVVSVAAQAPEPSVIVATANLGDYINTEHHGVVQVVTVPVNGRCTVRVQANGQIAEISL